MYSKYLIIFFVSFYFLGCGVIGYHEKVIDETAQYIKQKREEYEKQYVGKFSESVLLNFGKPYFIRENVFISGETYDEEWSYRIYKGQGITKIAHTLWFYIKNDKIAAVSVW